LATGSLAEFAVYAVLPASDLARARTWYQEKQELTHSEEMPATPGSGAPDGTWFILTETPNAGTANNTAAGFTVKGIESVMEDLRSRGAVFEHYDYGEMGGPRMA
jgi:hypothetical protein